MECVRVLLTCDFVSLPPNVHSKPMSVAMYIGDPNSKPVPMHASVSGEAKGCMKLIAQKYGHTSNQN